MLPSSPQLADGCCERQAGGRRRFRVGQAEQAHVSALSWCRDSREWAALAGAGGRWRALAREQVSLGSGRRLHDSVDVGPQAENWPFTIPGGAGRPWAVAPAGGARDRRRGPCGRSVRRRLSFCRGIVPGLQRLRACCSIAQASLAIWCNNTRSPSPSETPFQEPSFALCCEASTALEAGALSSQCADFEASPKPRASPSFQISRVSEHDAAK